jgi:hypothetical protein
MGVRLMNLASGDSVVGLARNAESAAEADTEAVAEAEEAAVEEGADAGPADPAETDGDLE